MIIGLYKIQKLEFCLNELRIRTCFVRGSITVGTANLLLHLFGFSCFAYLELTTYLLFGVSKQEVNCNVNT